MQSSQGSPRTVIAVQAQEAVAALHPQEARRQRLPRLLHLAWTTLRLLAELVCLQAVYLRRQWVESRV